MNTKSAKWKRHVPLLLLTTLAAAAGAQTLNYRHFDYTGQVDRFGSANWRLPDGFYGNAAPGLYFAFYGKADPVAGCATDAAGGPLPVFNNIYWANLYLDTGISSGGTGTEFSPYSNHPECAQKDRLGFTHAHYKNFSDANSVKGLGLYSYTGPTPVDGSLSFFQVDNLKVQGNFAQFINCSLYNTPCSAPHVPRPFSGTSSDHNLLRVALVSYQGLVKFSMESPSTQQVRQQIVVNFESLTKAKDTDEGYPGIQYLLSTAIAGLHADNEPAVNFDPAMGGMPYIGGRLGTAGQTATALNDEVNYPLWTSWGESTKSSTWSGQKRFQAEISFTQFQNALKLAAAAYWKIPASQVTDSHIASRFGPQFKQPLNWVVSAQSVTHEVYNADWETKRAVVGGNVTELKVLSLPY